MDHEPAGSGTSLVRTDPALPPGAMATLERSVAAGGGSRGPRSLARRLGPLTSVLVLGVFAAAGFIGGVQVQKRQGTTPASTAATGGGAAARAAATTATPAAPAANATPGPGGAARAAAGAGGPAARAVGAGAAGAAAAGQVKLVDGPNLYVTDAQGNVVKVVTSPSSRYTKTGPGTIQDIRPGDTVIVQGQKGEDGIVTATAVATSGAATP